MLSIERSANVTYVGDLNSGELFKLAKTTEDLIYMRLSGGTSSDKTVGVVDLNSGIVSVMQEGTQVVRVNGTLVYRED